MSSSIDGEGGNSTMEAENREVSEDSTQLLLFESWEEQTAGANLWSFPRCPCFRTKYTPIPFCGRTLSTLSPQVVDGFPPKFYSIMAHMLAKFSDISR